MATPVIYKTTTTDPTLDSPTGIAVNPDIGEVLVASNTANSLVLCKLQGLSAIDTITSYVYRTIASQNELYFPTDISNPGGICYYDGYYYFCDAGNHVVVRLCAKTLNYKGHFGTIGTSGSTTALLNTPSDVCTDKEYLYVADSGNNRIMKLNLDDLTYNSTAGTFNSLALDTPSGIAYSDLYDRHLYISDTANDRIVKCLTDFTYIASNVTDVSAPVGITVKDDMVHVCDGTDVIMVFSQIDLTKITYYDDTTVAISTPYGICSYRDSLYITDKDNDRITVWRAYKPIDALTSSSGSLVDGSEIIADDDSVIAGATSNYATQNEWMEDDSKNDEVAWVDA
jgi:DNA-binding beta-propeller fold protein YncE